jgi:hypothetical protein
LSRPSPSWSADSKSEVSWRSIWPTVSSPTARDSPLPERLLPVSRPERSLRQHTDAQKEGCNVTPDPLATTPEHTPARLEPSSEGLGVGVGDGISSPPCAPPTLADDMASSTWRRLGQLARRACATARKVCDCRD